MLKIKAEIKKIKNWWSWIATCDVCNKKIHGHELKFSTQPDTQKKDYCIKCMRSFFDDNVIPVTLDIKAYTKEK